ncbi:penicillin-insensitive murein endopeptidase [Roseomonas sp. SSH11]|uniref:Penicillin-insensitive murein endopeptidase n=1 Tax=Pararoseomonas baculiformis TaxID=2820812 RepID=A0ABS4AKD6_9PROT|nr:penicillin-insensitive murein endopeptidase [Pararoseomonas baculiformis]MBP0447497.1 penicillin-insensitive murein endopeptidase [Pararoseomonas baculiformis]
MRQLRCLAILASFLAGPALAQPARDWAAAPGPAPGPARSIGNTSLGCVQGAEMLPAEGPGWQAVRLSRNRNWGHPVLITAIRDLAGRTKRAGLPDLWIGDLGQPRGGPLPFGHASHQAGLDVDIWLDLSPKPLVPSRARESIPEQSLVLPDQSMADPSRFTPAHARLIRMAAELPGVDRIFVNHGIKRSLCAAHAGEPWLRMVRPWRGHDSHMHIRLRCPADSPECRNQPPVPAGDGCDAGLDWWLSPEARTPSPRTAPPGPPPRLPASCTGIFSTR